MTRQTTRSSGEGRMPLVVRLVLLMLVAGGATRASATPWNTRERTTPGYLQPIEIVAPAGTSLAFATEGGFFDAQPTPAMVGLQVTHVYRLRVDFDTGRAAGRVYPTIELVDRLYPPVGQELEFPVPIELTEEDLRLAAEGHFVTRVIYVEDPLTALPTTDDPQRPRWFDAGPGVSPLEAASAYGRPVAILRMGGRQIDEQSDLHGEFVGTGGAVVRFTSRGQSESFEPASVAPQPAEPPQPALRTTHTIHSRYSPRQNGAAR